MTEDQEPQPALELFVGEDFTRRSRWTVGLLMVNWIALGFIMTSAMRSDSPVAYAAGAAGLLTIAACAAKLRAARISSHSPLFQIVGGRLRVRSHASRVFRSVPLEKLERVERQGGVLSLVGRDGDVENVSLRGLSDADGEELIEVLGQVLQSR